MSKSVLLCGVAFLVSWAPAAAQSNFPDQPQSPTQALDETTTEAESAESIVITGARTRLPATALPLTFDVLGGEELKQQLAVSGSVIEAVSARLPAFSPGRE